MKVISADSNPERALQGYKSSHGGSTALLFGSKYLYWFETMLSRTTVFLFQYTATLAQSSSPKKQTNKQKEASLSQKTALFHLNHFDTQIHCYLFKQPAVCSLTPQPSIQASSQGKPPLFFFFFPSYFTQGYLWDKRINTSSKQNSKCDADIKYSWWMCLFYLTEILLTVAV